MPKSPYANGSLGWDPTSKTRVTSSTYCVYDRDLGIGSGLFVYLFVAEVYAGYKHATFGKGQMGSTLMGAYILPQQHQGIPFSQSGNIHYSCSGPISADPICPKPTPALSEADSGAYCYYYYYDNATLY